VAATGRTVAGAALLAALAGVSAPAPGLGLAGTEVVLDPGPECGASGAPDAASLVAGGHVVVWPSTSGVCHRRLDDQAVPVGPGQVLASGSPVVVAVTAVAPDGYAVAWFDLATSRLALRRVGAGGTPGPQIVEVATLTSLGGVTPGIDLTASSEGDLFVVWTEGPRVWSRRVPAHGPLPPGEIVDDYAAEDPAARLHDPVVELAAGGLLVVWTVGTESSREGTVVGRRRELTGNPGLPSPGRFEVSAAGRHAAMVAVPTGVFIAWAETHTPPGEPGTDFLLSRLFDADGAPADLVRGLSHALHTRLDHAVAASDGEHVYVAWDAEPLGDGQPSPPLLRLRRLDLEGLGDGTHQAETPAGTHWGQRAPALAAARGRVLAAWHAVESPLIGAPAAPFENLRARVFPFDCVDGDLCLGGGRFALSLAWSDPRRGLRGFGQGVPLTEESGYFWFFASDNVEVVVKILDGSSVNGHFWLFYGSLTDLGFELLVVDTETGERRSFVNPPGTMASHADTTALPAGLFAAGAELHALTSFALVRDAFPAGAPRRPSAPQRPSPRSAPASAAGPCSPPELPVVPRPGLCLSGRRFEVEATWRDFDGNQGAAEGVHLGDDTGYFWFFAPDNVELVLKLLDGRTVNGRFWVFYGALSSVEYELTVRHVLGEATRTYRNEPGTLASVGDVEAFAPPRDCGCAAVHDPVCGADGRTYGNACEASCTGWVPVAHHGPCGGQP
jgi:hypothetical protein